MSAVPSARPRAPFLERLKRVAPWVIAVVAMAWVLRTVVGLPPQPERVRQLEEVIRQVPYGRFLLVSAVLVVANCAADTLAMFYTFRWFGCALPYRQLFVIRAATYMLAVVQYYVGQAAILTFLHRRYGVGLARGAGWILFISGINMGVLVLLAAVGLLGGDPAMPWMRMVPLGVGVGAVLYGIALWWKPRPLASVRVLAPLFEVGVVGHLKAIMVRLPHVLVLIVWHYLVLHWFGVAVPVFTALVLLPAVFFAAALPISVQGLGLSQAAAVYFFGNHEPAREAAVLAYSLAMTSVSLVAQVTLGLLFLPAGRRLGLEAGPARHDPAPATAVAAGVPAVARRGDG